MTKWEYKVIDPSWVRAIAESDLNRLGEEGWELVSVTATDDDTTAYLKRAVPHPDGMCHNTGER